MAHRAVEGSCHCGAIAIRFQASRPPERWPIRACQCGFCRRHGARTTSDPAGRVSFQIHDEAALARYRFAERTADFLVCRNCGVYLAAVLTCGDAQFATLNVNALCEPLAFDDVVGVSYDGESAEERQRRRAQRWTPVIGSP
jgi:hypothetical protein